MALTNWGDILNKPKSLENVDELEVSVAALSASVLTIAGDVQEIELEVSQLSASKLPYNSENSTKEVVETKGTMGEISDILITNDQGAPETQKASLHYCGNIGFLVAQWSCQNAINETLTLGLPTEWNIVPNNVVGFRDRTNGNIGSIWGSGKEIATYNHTGTMTVGNNVRAIFLCIKTLSALREHEELTETKKKTTKKK